MKECVDIGTGTKIIQHITIGNNTIIGAGAVVIRNIESNVTAVGSPAKVIKYHRKWFCFLDFLNFYDIISWVEQAEK